MRSRLAFLAAVLTVSRFAVACGGAVGEEQTGVTRPVPGFGTGGAPTVLDAGSGGGGASSGGASNGGSGGTTYRDPECPPPSTKPGVYECDPYDVTGCGAGAKCSPYVDYADNCGTEVIGTTCVYAGTGVQGDDCTQVNCAAGYVCATGGVGLICVKLCKPQGGPGCDPGLICTALDVDGFYVCD